MHKVAQKFLRYSVGWALVIVGIIGLFVPFLQGIALIIAGFVVLENKYVLAWIKRIKERWHQRKTKRTK